MVICSVHKYSTHSSIYAHTGDWKRPFNGRARSVTVMQYNGREFGLHTLANQNFSHLYRHIGDLGTTYNNMKLFCILCISLQVQSISEWLSEMANGKWRDVIAGRSLVAMAHHAICYFGQPF